MDCNTTASSTFGDVGGWFPGVGITFLRGGVGGLCVCSSFGVWTIVMDCRVGLGSSSCRCECDDASRRFAIYCTRVYVSFFLARVASIFCVITSGSPPFASCNFLILIS